MLAELEAAPHGERNVTLNKAAFRLAQLVAGGMLNEPEAKSELERAARITGLESTEITNTIRSGWEAGLEKPVYNPEISTRRNGYANDHLWRGHLQPVEGATLPRTEGKGASVPALWPEPPGDEAFMGLPGRIVNLIDPHTEADKVAVLINLLTAFGCAVGNGPYATVGATRHYPRLFATLVGRSAKARKGDSWPPVRVLFNIADPEWASHNNRSGLSSGEGLIGSVRDRVTKECPVKDRPSELETVVVEEGVSDKRMLIIEAELARVLRVMGREGNTLSSVIREAWDTGDLHVMTKTPLDATGAHICLLAHITAEELKRELTQTDAANGFGNRFMWFAVKRSKALPDPDPFTSEVEAVRDAAQELKEALEWARDVSRMARSADASELWGLIYRDLSDFWDKRTGLASAIVGRAEAQVLRLSMLYALLDRSSIIDVSHLKAALELWAYAEDSAVYIFGDATGDNVADTILSALRQRGRMTRTEISGLFGRHVPSDRIQQALLLLERLGKAVMTKDDSSPGRPTELWSIPPNRAQG